MPWRTSSVTGDPPDDPVGDAVAQVLVEVLQGASVELAYAPVGLAAEVEAEARDHRGADDAGAAVTGSRASERADAADDPKRSVATGEGPDGWVLTVRIALNPRIPVSDSPDRTPLLTMLGVLPQAALRASARFRPLASDAKQPLSPAVRRALRDVLVVELLSLLDAVEGREAVRRELIESTIEFLVELGGTRVESHDLTHGVVITDALHEVPRLHFAYPADLESAKRGPLLFDGQRSVLIVDRDGNARTELQRHRFDRLTPEVSLPPLAADLAGAGSLVAAATRLLGGVGLFLRADRTIWVFLDGRPLLLRRAEHWTAFPLELAASVADMIGGGRAAELVVETAFLVSAQQHGAILAIVADPAVLDGIVSAKDRFDLRNSFDPTGTRVETRLHHLIDANELDAQTLARLATLDGATVLDRDGALLAYGAIVASSDSDHEGARTAAAKTLSDSALVVLKVSVDGDITIFKSGRAIATLLGQPADPSSIIGAAR